MKRKIDWGNIDIKEFAGLISGYLNENNIEVILVGGACVSIYSKNEYLSYDLDFVTYSKIKEIKPILKELGFKPESTRHFMRQDCLFYIEFVSPPVSVGSEESITNFNTLKTKEGTVKLLSVTDCVKDRLAAYYHWNDPQSLDQAVMVAKNQRVNLQEIERWSIGEDSKEKFDKFKKLLRKKVWKGRGGGRE